MSYYHTSERFVSSVASLSYRPRLDMTLSINVKNIFLQEVFDKSFILFY